jgi:predicted nucleotidyltransferase component of viral defense system
MSDVALTKFQQELLRLFFALPEASDFVLAGGAALIATGLSERATQDLDFFGGDLATGITGAAGALEAACTERGWAVTRVHDSPTFRRILVQTGSEELLVDLAVDSPALGPPTSTAFGPTYAPEELAARKLLALFDRAAARDFVDIHTLSSQFDLDRLVEVATRIDPGFDQVVLAEMLESVQRYSDDDLADLGAEASALRDFTMQWCNRLRGTP